MTAIPIRPTHVALVVHPPHLLEVLPFFLPDQVECRVAHASQIETGGEHDKICGQLRAVFEYQPIRCEAFNRDAGFDGDLLLLGLRGSDEQIWESTLPSTIKLDVPVFK